MSDDLKDRVQRAVEEGRKSRHAYYQAIRLPDAQLLGPPTPDILLKELEVSLKRAIPPSYRTFLQLHNGWRMANGAVDLLTVDEMLRGHRAKKIARWQRDVEEAGDRAAKSIVIGFGEVTSLKLLLDPSRSDASQEWRLIGYDNGEEWSCPSFLAWLEKSARDFQELADEELRGGSELDA